ncbi:hypothetical protein ACTXT7_016478 [Hymenolepis weldensis]
MGRRLTSREEVEMRLSKLAKFYEEGMRKLMARREDVMNKNGILKKNLTPTHLAKRDDILKYCHPPSHFKTVFKQSCPWLSTQGKIAVGLTMALVSILLLTIFYCYQRNKK